MVTDKNGAPLVDPKARATEFRRCAEQIGWGMPQLAHRLQMGIREIAAVRDGRRDIDDTDLAWLQQVAAAVVALPRPSRPSPLRRHMPAPEAPAMPAAPPEATIPIAAVVVAIVGAYRANQMPAQTLANIARRLNIIDAVQAALDATEPPQAPAQPTREPFANDAPAMIA